MRFVNIRTMETQNLYRSMYEDYVRTLAQFNPYLDVKFAKSYADDYFRQEFFEVAKIHLLENEEGETVGFIIISNSTADNHTAPGTDWCIHEFYIKPEYRRKGYGLEAVKEFQKEHTGRICYFILRKNEAAKKFWKSVEEKLGWIPLEPNCFINTFFCKNEFCDFFVSEVPEIKGEK